MSGTILNVIALLLGGAIGLLTRREPSVPTQAWLKILLGAFTVWTGLKITWDSLSGSFWQSAGQFGLAVLALSFGNATGNLLRLQTRLNHLGKFAKDVLTPQKTARPANRSQVFLACTVVFAANPLGLFGALLEGTGGHWEVLAIKAAMDGLSALAFARLLGWQVLLAAVPVLAFQGTAALGAQFLARDLLNPAMIQAIGAAGGLMVFSASLVVLNIKTVRLADYLPTFLFAPLLAWWLR